MTTTEDSFFALSKAIAEKFLQSTVVIDDWARFPGLGEEPVAVEMTIPLKRPPVGRVATGLNEQTIETGGETTPEDSRQLNAKKVIDGFASKGIICSIIKPETWDRSTLLASISQLSSNADIIVIDWSMHQDNGEIALQLIKHLASSDLSERTQLRLFAVYTIDPDAARIPEKIKAYLENSGMDTISVGDDGFSLTIGAIRIVVLSKPGSKIPEEYIEQIVPFEELADRLTSEFTDMTAGLVSNVVMDSLAEIRLNSHKIITNFARNLDAPYLAQKSLLDNPEDAEEHLVALVAAELAALLEERNVRTGADIGAIKHWIDYKKPGEDTFVLEVTPHSTKELSKEVIIELLEKGISNVGQTKCGLNKTQINNAHKFNLSQMYQCTDDIKPNLDERLAVIMSFRSFYGEPIPRLNLGTIIKTNDAMNKYYVCIQPSCDCVRITTKTSFLFLPMTIQTGDKFDLVVEDNGNYIRFSINRNSYDIKLIEFLPKITGKGRIVAYKREDKYYFKDARRKVYNWVGELRSEHAIRLSNQYATELSRVGLNESEWLRRYAK